MNPTTLNAIKLFSELLENQHLKEETKELLSKMLENLVYICNVEVEEAFGKYSKILR